MKRNLTEPPTGIIKTLPACYLDSLTKEGRVFHRCIERMNVEGSEDLFSFHLSSFPKHEVLFVYINILGAIRCRFNVVDFQQASRPCLDGVTRSGAWVACCGPVTWAPHSMPMRGFRGFRYTHTLW